jgi:hypothetical protein
MLCTTAMLSIVMSVVGLVLCVVESKETPHDLERRLGLVEELLRFYE